MTHNNLGRYFDEFEDGEIIEHALSKTIFESDNNLFCLLTMNHHPVHTNLDYAQKNQHGKLLVVGTLVFSLVVGLSVPDISGKAIANLEYESIKHLSPVFLGDTLYARTTVLSTKVSTTKPDRGIVFVETTGFNQNGTPVISLRRKVLIKRKI